jgi:hypothetical protein
MDYKPPRQPAQPNCIRQSQDLISGICTFRCSWLPTEEDSPWSCNHAVEYRGIFWAIPFSGSGYDTNWRTNFWSDIVTVEDGHELYGQVTARDGLGNTSAPSEQGGPFTCPEIIYSPTITPGGATPTPTITLTPSPTLTPTITLTPTPGAWSQVFGGDVYKSTIREDIPSGKIFLDNLSGNLDSAGVLWSSTGTFDPGFGYLSARYLTGDWKVSKNLSNTYSFSYYWEAFKGKAKNVSNQTVGNINDLDSTNVIYAYTGLGYYALDTTFTGNRTSGADVTIFLISGSLEVRQNFTVAADDTVVFIVNGNIYIAGSVDRIPGLYISSQTFTIATGSDRIIIDGMVYARTLSLNRTHHSFDTPAYQFLYQPKYVIALLPYLGRQQVQWQETP